MSNNAPPLPFSQPAGPPPAQPPLGQVSLEALQASGGKMQFPPGTTLQKPLPPFPPELQRRLDEARRCGQYCITVTIHDPLPGDDDRVTCYMERINTFKIGWLLPMWQTIARMILSYGVAALQPAPPIVPAPPASESLAGVSNEELAS